MSAAKLGKQLAAQLRPRPLIYWSDLLLSAAIGWGLFALALWLSAGSPGHWAATPGHWAATPGHWAATPGHWAATLGHWAATLGASIALLRAGYFIHEIAHLSRNAVPGFELGWHLLAGIPLLIPSVMIGAHKDHHRVATYGTSRDPEYAPIARWSRARLMLDLAGMLIAPALLILRWGVIAPVSWLLPPLRRVVVERMSTLAISTTYRRTLSAAEARKLVVQEVMMGAFVWGMLWLLPLAVIAQWWATAALALALNQVRTYVAHAYALDEPRPHIDDQVRDTLTLAGSVWAELLAPLGDRYHAAHHRFPSLPYHALPEAHARLLAQLPEEDAYRSTLQGGLSRALWRFWRRSRK